MGLRPQHLIDGHTNDSLPGNLVITRQDDLVILQTRKNAIAIHAHRMGEVVQALVEAAL